MTMRVRIATRGSRLALAQTNWVAAKIRESHPSWVTEVVIVRTSGDRFSEQPLTALGGKGLFVKEIEEALLNGEADCAVHSAKDLPAQITPELVFAAVPCREDPSDVLVTECGYSLEEVPRGAVLGTSSPRRAALLRWLRPGVRVVPCRGNVDTRLDKLMRGEVDGLLLAMAGLRRLGIWDDRFVRVDPMLIVPAVGQGALVVETRADGWAERLSFLHDRVAGCTLEAERAFLAAVGGSCHTSLGAHAAVRGQELVLHGVIADPTGCQVVRGVSRGSPENAVEVGRELAAQLLRCGGEKFLQGERVALR